jgi:WD40 repeat protein
MENVREIYSLFIQNQIPKTSHTLEWLPISHTDSEHSKFDWNYFVLGTHSEDEDAKEFLKLVRVRVPNQALKLDELREFAPIQGHLSRLEVVKEFEHEGEVIKSRCMPQNLSVVASMTNSGAINLYNLPEVNIGSDQKEVQRLKAKLTGLEEESFALSWNKNKQGLLCSASGTTVCVWDVEKNTTPSVELSNAHVENINDVKFSQLNEHLMISTSDDGHFKIWDLRTQKFIQTFKAADDSLCAGQFNPLNEHLFAVAGDSSGNVGVWDLRMPAGALNELIFH